MRITLSFYIERIILNGSNVILKHLTSERVIGGSNGKKIQIENTSLAAAIIISKNNKITTHTTNCCKEDELHRWEE